MIISLQSMRPFRETQQHKSESKVVYGWNQGQFDQTLYLVYRHKTDMTYVLCSLKPQDSIDRNFIFVQFHVGKWLRYSRLHCTTNNDVFVYTVCMSKRGFPAALLHRLIYCTLQNTVCSPILLQKKMHIKTNETLKDGGYRRKGISQKKEAFVCWCSN